MRLKINPSVRETNKYLKVVIDQLLEKHGKVSNPDFENELAEITGIGWKQVKNYKNHPRPSQRLKDNSKVLSFILQSRGNDKLRKVKLAFLTIGLIIGGTYVIYFILTPLLKPKYKVLTLDNSLNMSLPISKEVNYESSFIIPVENWVIALGHIKDSQINLDKFDCQKISSTIRSCQYERGQNGVGQDEVTITININNDFITDFTIWGGSTRYATPLFSQLSSKKFFSNQKKIKLSGYRGKEYIFETESERIHVHDSRVMNGRDVDSIRIMSLAKVN